MPSVRSLGDLHKHQQQIVAAIETARYTILKKMKLTDFTPQIGISPTAVGVGGGEPRGGALQPLTSPSPSAPEVWHRCTGRLTTAKPPLWSSSSPRRGPQAGGDQGPAILPPKALRILVRICSQVPAKVQSALLVHAFESRGQGRGSPKQRTKRSKQNWAERRPIVTKRSTTNANAEKSIPPAMSQQNQHLTHAMLRKPTTTPKHFFLWYGRLRSEARSLWEEAIQEKILHGHWWSHAA